MRNNTSPCLIIIFILITALLPIFFSGFKEMTSLKVDNLSYKITSEDLKPLFEKYGDVGDIYIPRDRFTKKSRGFSFVRFYDKRDAEEAMDRMNGYMLDGREMRVQLAKYGRPSEPRYNKSYGQSRRR